MRRNTYEVDGSTATVLFDRDASTTDLWNDRDFIDDASARIQREEGQPFYDDGTPMQAAPDYEIGGEIFEVVRDQAIRCLMGLDETVGEGIELTREAAGDADAAPDHGCLALIDRGDGGTRLVGASDLESLVEDEGWLIDEVAYIDVPDAYPKVELSVSGTSGGGPFTSNIRFTDPDTAGRVSEMNEGGDLDGKPTSDWLRRAWEGAMDLGTACYPVGDGDPVWDAIESNASAVPDVSDEALRCRGELYDARDALLGSERVSDATVDLDWAGRPRLSVELAPGYGIDVLGADEKGSWYGPETLHLTGDEDSGYRRLRVEARAGITDADGGHWSHMPVPSDAIVPGAFKDSASDRSDRSYASLVTRDGVPAYDAALAVVNEAAYTADEVGLSDPGLARRYGNPCPKPDHGVGSAGLGEAIDRAMADAGIGVDDFVEDVATDGAEREDDGIPS